MNKIQCKKCLQLKTCDYFFFKDSITKRRATTCKLCDTKRRKTLRESRLEIERLNSRNNYYKKRELKLAQVKARYELKGEEIRKYTKEWTKNNRGKINKYVKERKAKDPLFKFRVAVGINTHRAFKRINIKKDTKTLDLLGCTVKEAAVHIQSMFKPGMTWDNYGKWHIDHIIPLASAKTKEDIVRLCHYTNLQPLWAAENLKKGSKHGK